MQEIFYFNREYKLTRLDKANVMRSLGGAVERADDGQVLLGFCTKTDHLPDGFHQQKIPGGGSYIEAFSTGRFDGDYLMVECDGRTADNEMFSSEVGFMLSAIASPVFVSYGEAAVEVTERCRCPVCGKEYELCLDYVPAGSDAASILADPLGVTCRDCSAAADRMFGAALMEGLWATGRLGLAEMFCREAISIHPFEEA
jgi:hypothetical protein